MEDKAGEIDWELSVSLGSMWQAMEHHENLELGVGENRLKAVISDQ